MVYTMGDGRYPGVIDRPPERRLIDRLARLFEGGDRGAPAAEMLTLSQVVPGAPAEVADFYRRPQTYVLRAGATSGFWGELVMAVFAAVTRQMCIPVDRQGAGDYEVYQRIYRDDRGRLHWDRYARVDGSLARLFVARLEEGPGRIDETFVLWGVPVRLAFDVHVEGDAVVLTLAPGRSSWLARVAAVQYRTAAWGSAGSLRTQGDFRVPAIRLHVQTEFRIHKTAAGVSCQPPPAPRRASVR